MAAHFAPEERPFWVVCVLVATASPASKTVRTEERAVMSWPRIGRLATPASSEFREADEVREDAVLPDTEVRFKAGEVVLVGVVGDCGVGRAKAKVERETRSRMLCILWVKSRMPQEFD